MATKIPTTSTATLSTNGQLIIPDQFRKAMHLEPGDKLSLTLEGEKLVLHATKQSAPNWSRKMDARCLWLRPERRP